MAGASPHTPVPTPKSQIMHGGLFSEDGVTLDDIRKIERNRQPPDSGDSGGPGDSPFLPKASVSPVGRSSLDSSEQLRSRPCPRWALRPWQGQQS